ncbi:MAG: GntR family transcriptional regulator [Solirubrobacterales bacterium]|nr:GntR family transcriptional regulator [Solirubrobacterales bacterium]
MASSEQSIPQEPKYYVVKRHLLELIVDLEPGAPVPTERDLASLLGTSRTTVRQALAELVGEGRLFRRQGAGTFVAEPKLRWPLQPRSFTEQTRASGLTASSVLLDAKRMNAPAQLAEDLGIAPRAPVYRIDRLRQADGRPIAIEISWLSAERFPGLTRLLRSNPSLRALLAERYGVTVNHAEMTIETRPATPDDAEGLEIEVGAPLLVVSGHNDDADGNVVELGETRFRGDRLTLLAQINPPPGRNGR